LVELAPTAEVHDMGPSRRPERSRLALGVAGLWIMSVAVFPGCDVSRSAPDKPTAGAGCQSPGVTADQVRLGLLYPDTGNAASLFLPFRAGVDARLGIANDTGGVHGRRVVYSWRDDESRTSANLSAAHSLVDTDHVFGIIESTSAASGSAAFLNSREIPVTGTSLDAAWTMYKNMFSYSNIIADGPSITTWGDFVAARGGHRAVLAQTSFSTTSLSFARELTASLGNARIPVVDTLDVAGPIDVTEVGRRIKSSGADVLVGAVTGASFGQIVVAARLAGVNLRVILSPTGYDQTLLRLFGPILADVYLFVDYLPFEMNTPAHQTFLQAMPKYAPQMQPPNQQAALSGWISADMFLRGLQAAGGCPTRAGMISALRAVRGYDAGGLLPGPIDFTAGFGQLNLCYTFLQVSSDAKRFEVVPPAPKCGSRIK
jgi:branched-chain amino acid transport system substrate-binding protein